MPNVKGETPKQSYNKRLGSLKLERNSWEADWKDLQRYFMPKRGRFLNQETNRGDRDSRAFKMINNAGRFASRTLASGLMSGLTSPARPWFRLAPEDRDLAEFASVKAYTQTVERAMRDVFLKSNLYQALPALYTELGVIGTASMSVMPNFKSVIRCFPYTVGQYYLALNEDLDVDTQYREFRLTVRQWYEKSRGKVSNHVKNQYDQGNYDNWVDIVHIIEPNHDAKDGAVFARDKAFKSIYYEKSGDYDELNIISGFDSFPIMAPRWEALGEDVYGFSPGMDALGDNIGLQVQEKRKGQAIDKMVTPPLQAPSYLKNKPVTSLPGGVTYYNQFQSGSSQAIQPLYQVRPDITALRDDMNMVEGRINRAFYADLFLMLANSDRRQITATEVAERHEEKLLALGPVLQRLNTELLNPLIERTFKIMQEAEMLPEPPEELQEKDLKIEYISMLAQAQKQVDIAGIERFVGYVGNLANLSPQVLDKVDFDESVDQVGDMLGVPQKIIVSDEDVNASREQRAEQEQAAQALALGSQAAEAAKTLSDAKTSEQNALTSITGL